MSNTKHTVEVVNTDLEIEEELDLHEKGWRLQRFGWGFIYLIVLLGAIGLFGDGLLSKKTITTNEISVEYDRFYRHEAHMELKIDIPSNQPEGFFISFPNGYLKNFRIESVFPEATAVKISGDRVNYLFAGEGHSSLVFYLVPQAMGNISGVVQINQTEFSISHFIYP
jgi:hypothetical protein